MNAHEVGPSLIDVGPIKVVQLSTVRISSSRANHDRLYLRQSAFVVGQSGAHVFGDGAERQAVERSCLMDELLHLREWRVTSDIERGHSGC